MDWVQFCLGGRWTQPVESGLEGESGTLVGPCPWVFTP